MNLKLLCSPVLALMQRLSYARLFMLVGAVLLAPLVYLLYLQVGGAAYDVEFNQKESYGVENTEPARRLLQDVSLRRIQLAAAAAGVAVDETDVAQARKRMRQESLELDEVSKRLGPALANFTGEQKTVARVDELLKSWNDMDQASEAYTRDPAKYTKQLIADLNDFILNYVGNYSNLILDPDLDSYWLMDAYTGRLASLAESMVNIGNLALRNTVDGRLPDADRLIMAGFLDGARRLVADLETNFETAFNNNPTDNLRQALSGQVSDTLAQVTGFVTIIQEQLLSDKQSTISSSELLEWSSNMLASVHQLYADVGPQLDGLILARVDNYKTARIVGLVTGGLAVLLIIYVLLSFYFQVATELTAKINESEELRASAQQENESLNSNIMDLLTFVANCADGDLAGRAAVTEGALGNVADALNQMMDSWSSVISALAETVDETAQAGRKIGETAETMATGATRQVEDLEGATNSVKTIRTNISLVSENAATATTAAQRSQESAYSGSEMVQKIAEEMESLRSNVQAGAKKIKNLGDRSMEITGIVGTIAKISEQTNMLALNAAIEAARAGEHGRGFSVVAEEVRKLAERTSLATQDIGSLISSIQAETSESVAAIEEQTRAVEHHADSVAQSGEVLLKIQHESTQTTELIHDMNRVAEEQVPAAQQTMQDMLSVSEIARETQESAKQAQLLSKTLGDASERLVGVIGSFKVAD
ncbi:MAG: methyl-accepting chemotaxis protein [Planctomycetota bacterium]